MKFNSKYSGVVVVPAVLLALLAQGKVSADQVTNKTNSTQTAKALKAQANGNQLKVSGRFTAGGTINIRNKPSTSGKVEGSYAGGETVNYDQKVSAEGYDWISWISYSGSRHYMVERVTKTKEMWGKDSNPVFPGESKGSSSKDQPKTPSKPTTDSKVNQILSKARAQIGKPYVWGATGPNSFDCSGLTQYVYSNAGIKLPRTSEQQATCGKAVNMNQLKAGDLLFLSSNGDAYHVGIYTGNGKCLFAPQPGQNIKEQPMSYWMPQFARRVLYL